MLLCSGAISQPCQETLGELHCLPLAERDLRIGRRASLVPVLVLATAMGLVAFNVVPVAIAFFGAAIVLLLVRSLSLRYATFRTMANSHGLMLGQTI